jgi:hypothetical protein
MACAGVIRLDATVLTHENPEETSFLVALRNSGDDAALQVSVEGCLAGVTLTNAPLDLAPGTVADTELIFPTPALAPGTHVAEFRVRYRDHNGYPYATVAVQPIRIAAGPGPARVSATVIPAFLKETGRLRARLLLEPGAPPLTVRLRFLVADDLACDAPHRTVALFPDRPVLVEAALSNRTARAGSVYPVFAIVTEIGTNTVRETMARGVITLGGGGTVPFPWPGLAFAAAVLLALLFAVAQAGGKGRRPHDA